MVFLYITGFVTLFVVTGLLTTRQSLVKLNGEILFACTFQNKLIELNNIYFEQYDYQTNRGCLNVELYNWLSKKSPIMQGKVALLGQHVFIDKFFHYKNENYQVVKETIINFGRYSVEEQHVAYLNSVILQYTGILEERVEDIKARIFRPAFLFFEGIRFYVGLPFLLLNASGLISDSRLESSKTGPFVKIGTFIVAFAGLISSVVTIIQGQKQTRDFTEWVLFSLF